MLTENLMSVEKRIEEACKRANRAREEVTLIAVSKTKPVSMLEVIYNEGIRDFGENKVQELTEKYEQLPEDVKWHMIGHLQRNKVKYIAPFVALIHSVDSRALADTIEKEAAKAGRIIPVLIEVNVAGETTKFGVTPEEAPSLAGYIRSLSHVQLRGFMTSAPIVQDPEENRPVFRRLRQLSVDINRQSINNEKTDVLSMGMSDDFTVAVEEGSTCVRVGTRIFGARDYSR